MDKKEFNKKDKLNIKESSSDGFSAKPGKLSGFYGRMFGVIKFAFGVLLLPFVYSVSASFLNEFSLVPRILQNCFWYGVVSFLMIYLFVWEPVKIYLSGQKILEAIFRFFAPLVKVAPYLLPIYFFICYLVYLILSLFPSVKGLLDYTMFFFGFTIALHLVFSAKTMRGKQGDFLKGNYIFGFSFIYIINVGILAFILNTIFKEFSFVNFSQNSYNISSGIFSGIFRQLFLK
ncbi:MAG: hypothetical protein NTY47_06960 [Candidatus Omnitrophica bacterium]|nr:hypothetical protein [Candidatus Omnitrophota bacterium]